MRIKTSVKIKTILFWEKYFLWRLTCHFYHLADKEECSTCSISHPKWKLLTSLNSRTKETKWAGINLTVLHPRVLLPWEMQWFQSILEWKILPPHLHFHSAYSASPPTLLHPLLTSPIFSTNTYMLSEM